MVIKEPNQLYAIRETSRARVADSIEFRWRYKRGTHFLMVLTNALTPCSLTEVVGFLQQEGMDDNAILTSVAHKIYSGNESNDHRVFFLRERTFQKDNRVWRLNVQELNKKIPYRIDVYVCEEEEDGTLSIYDVEDDSTAFFLPLQIRCNKTLKTKGLLSKQYYAEVIVGRPEVYEEGSFQYLVHGAGVTIPLPERALGRPLMIKLPDSRLPMVFASEAYRKYYIIEENQ